MRNGHRGARQVLESLTTQVIGPIPRLCTEDLYAGCGEVGLEYIRLPVVWTTGRKCLHPVAWIGNSQEQAFLQGQANGVASVSAKHLVVTIISAGIVMPVREPVMMIVSPDR
jgi:hypothetical protein